MNEGWLSAVEFDCTARKGFGVVITPTKVVKQRACGPIWLNSDAKGVAHEGASK